MELTAFGFLVLPIAFLLVPFDPRRLLVLTIILAPFEAASVLNLDLGGFEVGIQPGYLAALLFVLSAAMRWSLDRQPLVPAEVRRAYQPLALFAGVAVLGALALPTLFAGEVSVFPPREGIALASLAPLEPSGTNLTQSAYLIFLCALGVAVAASVARGEGRTAPRSPFTAYQGIGLFVVALGVYQLAAHYASLPFPDDFLYSNPVYYLGFGQTIGAVKRMTSTFAEPSTLAYYLAGVFGFTLARYLTADRPLRSGLLAFAALAGLILSTSATAFATAAIVLLAGAVAVPARRRVTRLVTLAASGAFVLALVVPWLLAQVPAQVSADLELLNLAARLGTVSFVDRLGSDFHSLGLVTSTYGLGVGWGANRASSLLTTLLSTVGIAGVGLLVWFGWRVAGLVRTYGKRTPDNVPPDPHVAPLALSVFGMLVAGAIAVPDINHIAFWVNLSLLIGIVARGATPAPAPTVADFGHGPRSFDDGPAERTL